MEENEILASEAQPVSTEAAPETPVVNKASGLKKTLSQRWFKPALAVAIAIIVVVASIIIYNSFFSVEGVALRMAKAYSCMDLKTVVNFLAYDYKENELADYDGDEEAYFENMSDRFDEDISNWNDYFKIMKERYEESIEDEYGDYSITAKATRTKEVSNRRLEEEFSYLIESLEENTDFDFDSIQEAKEVTVKLAIKGEDDTERTTVYIYMVRIGLSWKVLEFNTYSIFD